jgi:hypothetical protein
MDSKLHFNNHVYYKLSHCIKMLDVDRSVTFSAS